MTQIDYTLRAKLKPIVRTTADGEPVANSRFEFETESSNNNLDYYFTRMSRRTLENFVADAKAGVQFLDSHNNRNLGYGRTFDGRFEIVEGQAPSYDLRGREGELAFAPEKEYMRAVLSTFTIPGIQFGGGLTYASTDDFIRAALAGIAQDISVGLYGGAWICDICGNNYRSYRDCNHYAGFSYGVEDQGDRQVIATVQIDGARLAEHSAVYDGATPRAMIVKAEEAARAGAIEPVQKQLLEARYKIELPDGRKIFSVSKPGRNSDKSGLSAAPDAANGGNSMDFEQEIRSLLEMDEEATAEDVIAAVRVALSETAKTRQLAEDGRAYRADLIEDALAEGVRALGETFQLEAYRGILEQSGIEVIKRMRDDWKVVGDVRFAGGRKTADETNGERMTETAVIPDAAYQ